MTSRILAATLTSLSLAGCVVAEVPASSSPSRSTTSNVSSTVVSNCLTAVANEVQNSNLSLIRTEASPGDGLTNVYVNVPGAQAPWLCRATAQGSVVQVMYTGSEGGA